MVCKDCVAWGTIQGLPDDETTLMGEGWPKTSSWWSKALKRETAEVDNVGILVAFGVVVARVVVCV